MTNVALLPVAQRDQSIVAPPSEEAHPLCDLLQPYFEDQRVEWVLVAGFDRRGHLLRFFGEPDEVDRNSHFIPCVRAAIADSRVAALVIAHNHPDGPPTPSRADIDVTRLIAALCRLAQVELVDHLIHSPSGMVSMRDLELIV